MQGLLRQTIATVASAGLIFCCSCERHYPDELPQEGKAVKSEAAAKEAPHDQAKAEQKHTSGDQQQMSTTALTPTPSPTPANFFPSPTP